MIAPWAGRTPRRWQGEALDAVLGAMRSGTRRPLVQAATGAGKALLVGELAALCKGRVLVTTPTQALVEQLSETLDERCPGEVGQAYQHAWQTERRIVVTCTPSLPGVLEERKAWDCWIADETHKAESAQARATRPEVKVAVGLTATPFRSDERGLEYWDRCVYAYTSADAVRDGVLVPWRVVRWDGEGDGDTDALCRRWLDEAEGPGIVSAVSIEDAESFAAGVEGVEAVHSHLTRAERRARIERLRRGELRALVHVALLVEGVDLPWLRWLMIRRPVSSPVRLVQEVGRVLRCAPGKEFATLYDPHDCLGAVGLTHAARLEDGLVRGAGKAVDAWEIPELAGVGEFAQIPKAVAVDRLSGWVCDLLGTLRGAGLAEPPSHGEGPWRQQKASEKQRAVLGKLVWSKRYLPDPGQRKAVDWLATQERLRSGTASDLISVLRALAEGSKSARERRTHWHVPVALPSPGGVTAGGAT